MKITDFEITGNNGIVSKSFNNLRIKSFAEACQWVESLDYKRNHNKNNKLVLFDELCGTCSTKHALLKRLADENEDNSLRLILGIFTMNSKNTPAIKDVLTNYDLRYIPEAHNYLRNHNHILDFTGIGVNIDIISKLHIPVILEESFSCIIYFSLYIPSKVGYPLH
ncbi:hypothetical protein HX021_13560 [Sphingobacterium sp. N143]|uniref:hypothetical protein n=1 Tax=Sphingobacterium sp. N143 TaxID=2746727 RepID=UPI00257742F8|nr:hypothetical protein [Sphingobacterium sp. N143]MDM1295310.1 hypothetical protein [Sphingobacterium sp. N143]